MSQPRSLQGKQGNRTYFCTLCVFSLADVVLEKQLSQILKMADANVAKN